MNEQEYLENRLEDQMRWYSQKSRSNRKWYHSLRVIEIVAAASIPLLAGVIAEANTNKFTLASLGFLVTIVAGLLSLYRFQELWIEYRTTLESLKHERFLFLTRVEPYDIEEPFRLLVERVEALVSKEHSKWISFTKRPKKEEQRNQ